MRPVHKVLIAPIWMPSGTCQTIKVEIFNQDKSIYLQSIQTVFKDDKEMNNSSVIKEIHKRIKRYVNIGEATINEALKGLSKLTFYKGHAITQENTYPVCEITNLISPHPKVKISIKRSGLNSSDPLSLENLN